MLDYRYAVAQVRDTNAKFNANANTGTGTGRSGFGGWGVTRLYASSWGLLPAVS